MLNAAYLPLAFDKSTALCIKVSSLTFIHY